MKKAKSLIFRRLTNTDFRNISGQGGVTGGGGQTYIDNSTSDISVNQFRDFFGMETQTVTNGPKWIVPIRSLSFGIIQPIIFFQRRATSIVISSQTVGNRGSNRISAWSSELTGFPSRTYNINQNPIVVYIIKDSNSEYWAGWFYINDFNNCFDKVPQIASMRYNSGGYIIFDENFYFSDRYWDWPFIGDDTNIKRNNYMKHVSLNSILYGPPGTGKTYHTTAVALAAIEDRPVIDFKITDEDKEKFKSLVESKQIRFVTFHQSYSYEDFVEGIKAEIKGGQIDYVPKNGISKDICNEARLEENKDKNYVLIIDEINRGNISNIFGELITLIEPSKREGAPDELAATLPYSEESFTVPSNLYIIGTMNSADKSIALMDTALRRRFEFIEYSPDPNLLETIQVGGGSIDLKEMLQTINRRIEVLLDKDHTIGHAYLMNVTDIASLRDALVNKIIPLVEEYFYNEHEKIRLVFGDNDAQKEEIYQVFQEDKVNYDHKALFGKNVDGYDEKRFYHINPDLFKYEPEEIPVEIFTKIYKK